MSSDRHHKWFWPVQTLALVALAGSAGAVFNHIYAAEPSAAAGNGGVVLEFPAWEPLFESAVVAPPKAPEPSTASGVIYVSSEPQETYLLPAESFDESLRVAGMRQGEARAQELGALWRRYGQDIVVRSLKGRLTGGTLEAAALAAEVYLARGEEGQRALLDLLASSDTLLGDRTAHALATVGTPATQVFSRGLQLTQPAARLRSAWGLGRMRCPDAAVQLGKLNEHDSATLRAVAVEALGTMRPEDRGQELSRFADDGVPAIRRRVAEFYALEPSPQARKVIQALAGDPDETVRVAAAVALSVMGDETTPALHGLLKDPIPAVRAEVTRALVGRVPDDGKEELLRHRDPVVRLAAFETVLADAHTGVLVYRAMAQEPDAFQRQAALDQIARSSDPLAGEAAAAFLLDPDGQLALFAFSVTARDGFENHPERLLSVASQGSPAVQRKAVAALINCQSAAAVSVLAHFLQAPDPQLRRLVIARLGEVPLEANVAALAALHKDPDPEIRRAALVAISRMPYASCPRALKPFLVDPVAPMRVAAVKALGSRKDPQVAMFFMEQLEGQPLEVRQAMVGALTELGDDVAAGALSRFLSDESASIRQGALVALAHIGTPMALSYVGSTFQHSDPALREASVAALREAALEEPEVVAREVVRFLHDPASSVKTAAIEATGATGQGEVVEALAALAEEQEARVRLKAVEALQRVRDDRAIAGLQQFRDDSDPAVRKGVYRGFARVGGDKGFAMLVEGLDDKEEAVRLSVISSVGELRLSQAVPTLKARFQAGKLSEQRAIINALGRIPSEDARSMLLDLTLTGGDWQKTMARKALEQSDDVEELRRAMDGLSK